MSEFEEEAVDFDVEEFDIEEEEEGEESAGPAPSESDESEVETDSDVDDFDLGFGAGRDHLADTATKSRKILIVADENRQTSERMTIAELSRAVSIRAQEISRNGKIYIDIGDMTDAKTIALTELLMRRSPLVLRRCVGYSEKGERIIERWSVREMTYPPIG